MRSSAFGLVVNRHVEVVAEIQPGTLPAGLTIWLKYQSFAKAHHIVVGANNAEAQPVWARREAPYQNAAFRQSFKPALRVLVPHQPEEHAAADKVKTRRRHKSVSANPCFASRIRAAASQASSIKAFEPMAMAAPELGQGPSAARNLSTRGFGAMANPSRSPGKP